MQGRREIQHAVSFSCNNKPTTFCIGVLITGAKLESLKTRSLSHAELQPDITGLKFLYSAVDVLEAYVAQNCASLDLSPKLL